MSKQNVSKILLLTFSFFSFNCSDSYPGKDALDSIWETSVNALNRLFVAKEIQARMVYIGSYCCCENSDIFLLICTKAGKR